MSAARPANDGWNGKVTRVGPDSDLTFQRVQAQSRCWVVHFTERSRLSCQIAPSEMLESLHIEIAPEE